MTDWKDKNGLLLPDEKRLTKAGKFVRKTSIDELPQLLNVIITVKNTFMCESCVNRYAVWAGYKP